MEYLIELENAVSGFCVQKSYIYCICKKLLYKINKESGIIVCQKKYLKKTDWQEF